MIEKERALCDTLASLDSVVVAYSGGVDSAYLAYIAGRTLGDRAVAVTADSPSYPERHRELAIRIARDFGLRHEIIHTRELERPESVAARRGKTLEEVAPAAMLKARAAGMAEAQAAKPGA